MTGFCHRKSPHLLHLALRASKPAFLRKFIPHITLHNCPHHTNQQPQVHQHLSGHYICSLRRFAPKLSSIASLSIIFLVTLINLQINFHISIAKIPPLAADDVSFFGHQYLWVPHRCSYLHHHRSCLMLQCVVWSSITGLSSYISGSFCGHISCYDAQLLALHASQLERQHLGSLFLQLQLFPQLLQLYTCTTSFKFGTCVQFCNIRMFTWHS